MAPRRRFPSVSRRIASAKHMPLLTAGGRSDEEMAAPTSELPLLPSIERTTEAPEGIAIRTPTMTYRSRERVSICGVPKSDHPNLASAPQKPRPMMKPTNIAIATSANSSRNPTRSSRRPRARPDSSPIIVPLLDCSSSTVPITVAKMGPIIGLTSEPARTATALSVARPSPETMEAITMNANRSKFATAPAEIRVKMASNFTSASSCAA